MTKWDNRFIDMARLVSSWSKDPSTQVGAVIVRPDRTVAGVGYNGFPRGYSDDPAFYIERSVKYDRIVHAEANAILGSHGPLNGTTIYTWPIPPCSHCAGLIVNAGITRVVSPPPPDRWAESCAIGRGIFEAGFVDVDVL